MSAYIDKNVVTNNQDFDRLVSLAQELKKSCDSAEVRSGWYRGIELVAIMCCAVFSMSLGFTTPPDKQIYYLIVVVIFFIPAIFFIERSFRRFNYQAKVNKKALLEVLLLLRELETDVSRQQGWSVVERARFRIMLSRFEIGDKH